MDLDLIKLKHQELLLLAGDPKEHHLQAILLFHAYTSHQELICTGCLEDDMVDTYELPPNWNKDIDGVYSLRYQTKDKTNPETIYIKFVIEGDVLDINAIGSSNPGLMHSSTFKLKEIKESTYEKALQQFKDEIISKLLSKLKNEDNTRKMQTEERKEPDVLLIPILRNEPNNTTGFGDYGKSDLRPLPLDPLGLGGPVGGMGMGVGGGSLFGPSNPIFTGETRQNPEVRGIMPGVRVYPTGPGILDPNFPDDDHLQVRGIPTKKPQGGFMDPFGGGFGTGNRFGQGPGGFGGGGFGGSFF